MEEKKIFTYIKKLFPYIFILSVLASVFVNYSLNKQRTFTASAVINYNYEAAESGKTPINTDLDVGEIKSSAIMSKVIDRLSLSQNYSVDKLTSRLSVTPVPDADKERRKGAKLDEGEEYIYEPTTYIVSFTAYNDEGEGFARMMLDEVLDTYFSVFGENYINVAHISNKTEKIYEGNYDYLETVEYIDSCIEETINVLYQRNAAYPYFRSTETGTSFDDLIDEFDFIRSVTLKDLIAKIYKYQVTKNATLLRATYRTRIDDNKIKAGNEIDMSDDIEEVMAVYVKKMRESGNTNITYEYILDTVHEKDITDGDGNVISGDKTVTYDELIYAWRDHNLNDLLAAIDTEYCNFVLDAFDACTGKCGGICAKSEKTCTQISNPDYANIEADIKSEIESVTDELSELYKNTIQTGNEYNEYLGCKNISILSTSSSLASINVGVYSAIAFVFIMVVCCGGAVLLGRMNDIIISNFYTDKKTGFRNRLYFDKYLKKTSRKIPDDGTVIVSVSITNQREINDAHGRDVGDAVIKLFADDLKMAFAKMRAMYFYNENSHFIIVLEKTDAITADDALRIFGITLDGRESCENVGIDYKIGVAETFRDRVNSVRKLLVEAVNNSADYKSEPVGK